MSQPTKEFRYRPPQAELWQGRSGEVRDSRFHQIIETLHIAKIPSIPKEETAFGIVGFSCDEGVKRNQGRVGAAEGPQALRQAFGKLALHAEKPFRLFDFGDVTCTDGNMEAAQELLSEKVAELIKNNIKPLLFGGGHEIAWANYQGIYKANPKARIGIINFDAHLDMRYLDDEEKGSSGTSFLQIADHCDVVGHPFNYFCIGLNPYSNNYKMVALAQQLGVSYLSNEEIFAGNTGPIEEVIEQLKKENDCIYLTLCMDVFAEPYAPGVSAANPLGLTPWHVKPLIEHFAASGLVASFDIAELSPTYDRNGTTALLAATMMGAYVHAALLNSR